ncbi:sensor histidine kinase [Microbacterium marinilacus]|uniref:histidine kinase n=1 Tax=Microbacterium marinilacus TaxID=415209 RepID=A0ABP7BEV0_9MICO|nr:histidine kinase [Microbacterium marinilacus]MBY0689374.1 sensor domain-containing protein [Microbacterium marinilacus]
MTSESTPPPVAPATPPSRRRLVPEHSSPARVGLVVLQLAAIGLIGPLAVSALALLLGLGLGLLPVLGIGIVFLLGLVYLLYAIGWAEVARIDGLYDAGLPPLRTRPAPRPGFGGFLLRLWHQLIDPPMWRAIANAAIATLLGLLTLALFQALVSSAVLAFAPLYSRGGAVDVLGFEIVVAWAPLAGGLGFVGAAAAIVGVALLHGVLARAIVIPTREDQLVEQARVSNLQRAGAIRASEVERTRIERDLHDGVQPRLVSVGMTLGLAQQKIDQDPTAARALIEEAHTSTKAAITELRQLARGIHASVLDDRGLDAALSALAGRSHIPVRLDVRADGRCSRDAEAAVYFSIAESLTNAAKHSRASECRVTVRVREDGILWARVEDNGLGGARVLPGGGLDGISNRVVAAGGSVRLDSPVGGPTALEVSVPCAS